MKAARKGNAVGVGADGAGGSNYRTSRIVAQPTAAAQGRPFRVVVHGTHDAAWGAYIRREDAEAVASKLRQTCGFVVTVTEEAPR